MQLLPNLAKWPAVLLRERRWSAIGILATHAATLTVAVPVHAADSAPLTADIRRTEFGMPHVLASNWINLGFGLGFANAQDRVCDIAQVYVTARAERSRYWGPDDGNLESDFYRQRLIDSGVTPKLLADPKTALNRGYTELVKAFGAGYNKYVRDTPSAKLPEACRNQPWVKPITELDYYLNRAAGRRGPLDLVTEIANATPPNDGVAATSSASSAVEIASVRLNDDADFAVDGSNGWALGPAVTQGGSTILLSSPHWPWEGLNKPGFWAQRVMLSHMTIPGVFNHIGVARMGSVVQQIGHRDDVARTHTVSAVQRDVVYRLTLDPKDPTQYLYDGKPRKLDAFPVSVQVREKDGSLGTRKTTLYWSHYGPVIRSKDRPWDRNTAFTLRSVMSPLERLKVEEHKLALDRTKSTSEILEVLGRYQVQDTNTIAIDRHGNTLFADVGNIPHLDNALIARCGTARLLDGSRSECELGSDPDAARPGIFGPSKGAVVHQKDYVANSNNPPRFANPESPLTKLDDVFGKEGVPLSLRSRLGLRLIEERRAGNDGIPGQSFNFVNLQQIFMRTRVHAAELVLDDLLAQCRSEQSIALPSGAKVNLAEACKVLAQWDRTYSVESRGGHIFREFVREGGLVYADKLDKARPTNSPSKLDTVNPKVMQALAKAVERIESLGIALDAKLGDIQHARRGDKRIAVPGGDSNDGVFNYMTVSKLTNQGYEATGATGLFYFVEFGATTKSKGMLIYGVSSDPASPHYADQMHAYGEGRVANWRFLESEIAADPALKIETVTEAK